MPDLKSKSIVHWQELRSDLFRFIRSRVPSREVADDITQDTLLKIAKSIDSLKEEERLQPWAFSIAKNTIADYFRRNGSTSQTNEEPVQDEEYQNDNYNDEVASWLPGMIEELPEDDKLILTLTEIEGISQKEVAKRQKLGYSAVKSRVQRARSKLKKIILDCCQVETDRRGNVIDYMPRKCDC